MRPDSVVDSGFNPHVPTVSVVTVSDRIWGRRLDHVPGGQALETCGPAACNVRPLGYVCDFPWFELPGLEVRGGIGGVGTSFPGAGNGDVGYGSYIGLLGCVVARLACYR